MDRVEGKYIPSISGVFDAPSNSVDPDLAVEDPAVALAWGIVDSLVAIFATRSFTATNIQYDGDLDAVEGLPQKLTFDVDGDTDPQLDLADLISDKTGFCVVSFEFMETPLLAD